MAHTGGTRFKVLYDYDATTPHELTIKAGQTVFVTEELDKGWNRGYIGDQYGMFPAAYAEADTSSYGPPSAPLPAAPGASNPPVGAGSNSSGAETAVVTEDFPAKDSSQLALVTGQLVVILRKFPTGWASGESQGKTGMFPLKNVRIVDINEAAALRAESGPAPTGPAPAVATKKAGNKEKRMSRIRSNTLSALSRVRYSLFLTFFLPYLKKTLVFLCPLDASSCFSSTFISQPRCIIFSLLQLTPGERLERRKRRLEFATNLRELYAPLSKRVALLKALLQDLCILHVYFTR